MICHLFMDFDSSDSVKTLSLYWQTKGWSLLAEIDEVNEKIDKTNLMFDQHINQLQSVITGLKRLKRQRIALFEYRIKDILSQLKMIKGLDTRKSPTRRRTYSAFSKIQTNSSEELSYMAVQNSIQKIQALYSQLNGQINKQITNTYQNLVNISALLLVSEINN